MLTVSTERFEQKRKEKPRGNHYWRFHAVGATTGRRKAKEVDWTYETDGPFPDAKKAALEAARRKFGKTATVTVELIP